MRQVVVLAEEPSAGSRLRTRLNDDRVCAGACAGQAHLASLGG